MGLVALSVLAVIAAADGGVARPVPQSHICVERHGGTRAAKARPISVSVSYAETPRQELGTVASNELKCFELTGDRFSIQFGSPIADESEPNRSCGEIQVSGMRSGWTRVSLYGRPGPAPACPWILRSEHGHGPLPTRSARPEGIEKDFAVLPAVRTYAEARRAAGAAARQLGLKLDLRRARLAARGGLTFPRADCKAMDREYPCHVARGLNDDGSYVSIDEASAFFDAEEMGFLIILASGPKNDPSVRAVADRARALALPAEVRSDNVYEGCGH
jgi:hypothetical protein